MKATDYSRSCQFCEHYNEQFDDFGHLDKPRCNASGSYTKYNNTCRHFESKSDTFFTDINDDD